MAIKRRQNWLGQQRVDTPHLKSVESAVSNDFDELLSGLVIGQDKSYVVRGLKINMPGSIGASANGLQLIVENSSFLHGASNESGTFYTIPAGTPTEVLSSTTNDKVQGSFTPNTDNFVGIEFTRQVDDGTADQVNFWNPTTNVELTRTVPLAIILGYKIVISTSAFASNVMPIAVVQTDSANNVVEITDRRPLLYRLGTAGDSEPNPFYEYNWPESRIENFYASTSSTLDPFSGGDKAIGNMKDFFDAVMTELKLLKGTPYWYSQSNAGSLYRNRQDLGATAFTGKGRVSHALAFFEGQVAGMTTDIVLKAVSTSVTLTADGVKDIDTLISEHNVANNDDPVYLVSGDGSQIPTADIVLSSQAGQINWSEDVFLKFIGGRLEYKIEANTATDHITLQDNEVAYVNLVRGENIIPNLIFTNDGATVTSVGEVNWTTDVQEGDFIKDASRGDEYYYQIATVPNLHSVTLTENFQEASSGPSGFDAQYAWGVYETSAAPSTNRHVTIADRGSVPFEQNVFWLFFRSDDGGSPQVYVRMLGGRELEQGEEREVSDNTSQSLLNYIGAANESDNTPDYIFLANSVKAATENYNTSNGENLTQRASKLTSMVADKAQDKTIKLVSDHTTVVSQTNNAPSVYFETPSGATAATANYIVGFQQAAANGTDFTSITSSIDFGILISNSDDRIYVYENGSNTFTSGTGLLSDGDNFEIKIDPSGNVTFLQNGSVFYTAVVTASYPLGVYVSSFTQNYGPKDVTLNGYPLIDSITYNSDGAGTYNLVGGTFTKTSADGWDLAIRSDQDVEDEESLVLNFSGGSGTANAIIPSSINNGTIGLSGDLVIDNNQVAYYQVDRNAAFAIADLSALTVSSIDSCPLNENTFIFAYRLADESVYLWDNTLVETGVNVTLKELQEKVIQNKTVKLVKGGTWSWDLNTNTLKNSASAYVQMAGVSEDTNEISAQSIILDADGKVAYVTIKRTDGASVLSVNTTTVSDAASLNLDDTFIIARRVGSDVLIGTSSFLLKDREFLELDAALAEINRYHSQLLVRPEAVISKRVTISGADIAKLSGSQISLEQKSLLLDFPGVVIDFGTGEIFETDGITPFNSGANDFIPFTLTATNSEYFFYSISLLPNIVNTNNTITGQILVLPAAGANAIFNDAPRAPFPGSGIKLANVWVQENGVDGNINDIGYGNIITLGVGGSGSGGTGDANELLERLKNRLEQGNLEYMTPVIFASSEEDLVDNSSTATFSVVNSNYEFENIGDTIVSVQMLDDEFLTEKIEIKDIELIHYWSLEVLDDSATYEVSRDGGAEWQAVAVNRIGQSDTYRGTHTFVEEASNSYIQTIGGAVAGTTVFDNSNELSRLFTLANTTTIKKVTANITKTGNPSGFIYAVAIRDDGGVPSTDPADRIGQSNFISIDTLVSGNIDFDVRFTDIAEDYHIVFRTEDSYKASYNAGVDEIAIDNDGSGIIYTIEGLELDLRVRITSGTVEVVSEGFGIFYKDEDRVSLVDGSIYRQVETFDGTADNEDTFTLNWMPDPRLLNVYALGTGQTFRYGDFVLDGSQVIFPPNTFNITGQVSLEFLQVNGGSFDNADENRALLAANHFGSTDPAIDMSIADRGFMLRSADGTLYEIVVKDGGVGFDIYEVN